MDSIIDVSGGDRVKFDRVLPSSRPSRIPAEKKPSRLGGRTRYEKVLLLPSFLPSLVTFTISFLKTVLY